MGGAEQTSNLLEKPLLGKPELAKNEVLVDDQFNSSARGLFHAQRMRRRGETQDTTNSVVAQFASG
jgi:hypothetical protein